MTKHILETLSANTIAGRIRRGKYSQTQVMQLLEELGCEDKLDELNELLETYHLQDEVYR